MAVVRPAGDADQVDPATPQGRRAPNAVVVHTAFGTMTEPTDLAAGLDWWARIAERDSGQGASQS